MSNKEFVASPKQLEIIRYLQRVRGATINQMLVGIENINPKSSNWVLRKRKMYIKTERLLKHGIIEKKPTIKKGNMFVLTAKGLEEVYIYSDIENGYEGSGFKNDLGHFAYRTYVPPVDNDHFHLQTDVYNEVLNLMNDYPGVYDYRDNLHSVYSEPNAKGYLKPDGEMMVDNSFTYEKGEGNDKKKVRVVKKDLFFIEVDRTKERGVELNNKFKNYAKHFEILTSKKQPLPKAIIFVIPNRKKFQERLRYDPEQKRFLSIFDKFKKECEPYVKEVRLIFVELRKFKTQAIMLQDINRKKLLSPLYERIKITAPTMKNGTWKGPSGSEYITLDVNDGGRPKYILLMETEGYSSHTWINGYSDCQYLQSLYTTESTKESDRAIFYFVCVYSQLHPIPPLLKANKDMQSIPLSSIFYQNLYSLNAGGESLIWYDNNHKILDKAPFLY